MKCPLFARMYRLRFVRTGRGYNSGIGRLVLRGFDDVIFESSTPFSQQTISQHFSWPFDGQIRGKYPHIRRGPYWTMLFGQLRIEQVCPDRHIDTVSALRVEMDDRTSSH